MNQEVKKKWLAALRSGLYEQGVQKLHYKDDDDDGTEKFCCLGVLCDLAVEEGVLPPPAVKRYGGGKWWSYLEEGSVLPELVQDWADLNECEPTVKTSHGNHPVTALNDGNQRIPQHTFEQIAKIIEVQL